MTSTQIRFKKRVFLGAIKSAVEKDVVPKPLCSLIESAVDDDKVGGFETNQLRVLFFRAIRLKLVEVVAAFLRANPSLARKELNGDGALMMAAAAGNAEMLQLLLSCDAPVNYVDVRNNTALHVCAALQCDPRCIEVLLAAGADVEATAKRHGEYMYTPLCVAISHNRRTNVEILLRGNANVNVDVGGRTTPLRIAVKTNSLELSELLLECGAEVTDDMFGDCYRGSLKDLLLLEKAKRQDAEPKFQTLGGLLMTNELCPTHEAHEEPAEVRIDLKNHGFTLVLNRESGMYHVEQSSTDGIIIVAMGPDRNSVIERAYKDLGLEMHF